MNKTGSLGAAKDEFARFNSQRDSGAHTSCGKNPNRVCALIRYRSTKGQIIPPIRALNENMYNTEISRHPPRDKWWEQIEMI